MPIGKGKTKMEAKQHTNLLKLLLPSLFLTLIITGCGNECYDERDYKAKFAEMQSEGIRECSSKDMVHLSTNLISLEDDWLVTCYTRSPVRTYGFKIRGK